eukprot:CAMPEP_0202891312 /NCGR_PEP_ID=MMETSP1392-20130828/1405_1 /ASSEMBLY_ACC=CAM_ASM_000868 /TAXON_ID=225041 /ORGANISM="Chlamydomonas chlamydogama, Strain SAG 11-48b" /LENGTH=76 /DNA_ID=CAMNT_0049575025 /DNA_START=137 /DNA_END=367 /DNA_ORIENTATION=+
MSYQPNAILLKDPHATAGTAPRDWSEYGLELVREVGSAGWRLMRVTDGTEVLAKIQQLISAGFPAEPDYVASINDA